ncbi:hypothetical protein BLNAU_4874 [Blattamonas nauphoetae]|uniref:Uncharacterized protein n=1 Tax=Blattamonas nauphoetae TaxID=2049346 RepID=A0ABQ9Y8G1_9EUKA|nr:hypothetical protein BLNAU_4874 [Blattamonas nauphoetae]
MEPILDGCGMVGMWGTSQFDEINEKCGLQELFGERTVDDVTVKDSRVENGEPKRADHFWTIGGHPRICSSAPAIKAFPTSEESPHK